MKKQKHEVLTTDSELAAHWGVTDRRVRQLANAGIAARTGAKYDLLESDRRFIEHLRKDEQTQQMKRRALAAKAMRDEQRVARGDRELLSLEEVRTVFLEATQMLWFGAREWVGAMTGTLHATISDPTRRQVMIERLHEETAGIMRKAQEMTLTAIDNAESAARSALRNDLNEATRRLGLARAELGVAADDDDDQDDDDYDQGDDEDDDRAD
ncbi:MAG: hypothetical protein ACREDY_27100 [Bradyrhizobium sp.]